MSESEKNDNRNVEDHQPVKEQEVKEETSVRDALKEVDNDVKSTLATLKVSGDMALDNADGGDGGDADADSEAETLIQSPDKKRNSLAGSSTIIHQMKAASSDAGSIILANTSDKENATRKRKRSQEDTATSISRASSHRSSPLSSPVAQIHSEIESDDGHASGKETSIRLRDHSEVDEKIGSPKKRRRRPSDILSPSAHKRSKRNSDDATERRETRSATYPRPSDDEKSLSPEPVMRREHRRGASTQLTAGEHEKRKRGRPPAISTRRNRSVDRASDSSDDSEPRASRARPHLHKLASTDHDALSVKAGPSGPRKWKDKVGRTPLARACNDGDLDAVMARFAERPEDLHEPDNAKNTPLQIASIEGWEEVVEFLLSKGAEVNVKNIDGDSPLIDAVENGHVPVIRMLLLHGANVRMANTKGYEPCELAKKDDDSYEEIRGLLEDAKDKNLKKVTAVEAYDYTNRDGTSSRAASAASPRDSPPIGARSPPAFGSRRRTGRSESTRNDLLYQANTQENLVKLAGKGDVQGVANILSILEKAETESLIAAAKAGHEEVLQLLIAMGKPNPDPNPVRGPKMVPGYNTPMLAAIGRGHPDVVKLLVTQSGFNPTKTWKERRYYDLAEERQGDRWEEEVQVLKQAYDRYKDKKSHSPGKTRDSDKTRTRPSRRSSSTNSTNRRIRSPSATERGTFVKPKDGPHSERLKVSDPISDKLRFAGNEDTHESSTVVAADLDQNSATQHRGHRTRRSQSDLPALSALSNEPSQRRRRLVTGKEHRNRHTINTSSDNEEATMADIVDEERPQSAMKRARISSTPDSPEESSRKAALKKRRTILESSPDESRSRTQLPIPSGTDFTENEAKQQAEIKLDISGVDDKNAVTPAQSRPNIAAKDFTNMNVKCESSVVNSQAAVNHVEPLPVAEIIEPAIELAVEPTVETTIEVPEPDEEDEDPYSPPPAVEPLLVEYDREAERKANEEAERLAVEEAARQEAARREEERIVQEKAAEEARIKEANEQRKQEQEETRQRQEVEKQEKQRQEMESRRRQIEREMERERLESLPLVLAKTAQMIDDNDPTAKSAKWLRKFLPLYSVKTKQLDDDCEPAIAEDQWVPNFQVAGLLSTKDLELLNYTSLNKRSATPWQRQCLWRVARIKLSYDFNPTWTTTTDEQIEIERIAEEKFMAMPELFWVKLSDFLDHISHVQHLHGNAIQKTQAITLKSYNDIFGAKMKTGGHIGIVNGVSSGMIHTNGENGVS